MLMQKLVYKNVFQGSTLLESDVAWSIFLVYVVNAAKNSQKQHAF